MRQFPEKSQIFLLLTFYASIFLTDGLSQPSLEIKGIKRVAHSIEEEMKYQQGHTRDLSAWYQMFFVNDSDQSLDISNDLRIEINHKTPDEWHKNGTFSWHQFPVSDPEFPKSIPPRAMIVGQFNGKNSDWLINGSYRFSMLSLDTTITDNEEPVKMTTAVFTGGDKSIFSDELTMHLENQSGIELKVEEVVLWLPKPEQRWPFLYRSVVSVDLSSLPEGNAFLSGKKSLVQVKTGKLAQGPVVIEVHLKDKAGRSYRSWSFQKIKKESFDISGGWANGQINKTPAFLNEQFLQAMQSLYINTAHYNGQSGFSDKPDLYNRYPIKYFGHLKPWQQFDQDSLLARLHGVEILGEPQYGGGTPVDPQKVNDELSPYHKSRLITTLTHSEERIWRFYAGLSDYPHFDAYRVTAPSADEWKLYNRWNGKRISWGSPLETIGTMTRSLKRLNRPVPIAYWSQGPHEGWEVYGGRKRTSPTPSELRSQAYHALASGITSLYWFNLSYRSLILFPELLEPMQRIGREIRLLEQLLITGDQWYYERVGQMNNPQWDLSTLVSPKGILLFALDLDYRADDKTKTFIFNPERNVSLNFSVPEWVHPEWVLLKVTGNDLKKIPFEIIPGNKIKISDSITETGMYLLISSDEEKFYREQLDRLLLKEKEWAFNPAKNPADLSEFIKLDLK